MLDRNIPDGHIPAMMTLSEYLKAKAIRQADFAARIGVTQGTVSRLCSGRLAPDMETASRIQFETGGAVPVAVWVPEEYRVVSEQNSEPADYPKTPDVPEGPEKGVALWHI